MMGFGAKILQVPAVEMAAEFGMKLAIGNSKTGVAGTIITEKPLAKRTLGAVIHTPVRQFCRLQVWLSFRLLNGLCAKRAYFRCTCAGGKAQWWYSSRVTSHSCCSRNLPRKWNRVMTWLLCSGRELAASVRWRTRLRGDLPPSVQAIREELHLENRLLLLVPAGRGRRSLCADCMPCAI